MSDIINLRGSYFGIANPVAIFDRWLHRFRFSEQARLRDKTLFVEWTNRAQQKLDQL